MMLVQVDLFQSAAMAAVVLVAGMALVKKIPVLQRYCIPAAVIGGLLFSMIHYALHSAGIVELSFDTTLQNMFMIVFFCSVGYMACFRELKRGGKTVLTLLGVAIVLILCQDAIGSVLAPLFGMDPKMGLAVGSISLIGGHGTAGSFGPLLENQYGITGATVVALAAATYGLVMGGVIGGPLARRRVEKMGLRPSEEDLASAVDNGLVRDGSHPIEDNRFLLALILLSVAIGIGTVIDQGFSALGITVPVYIGAMVAAMVIRNLADGISKDVPYKEVGTLGWICLSMFLSMALMSMRLWELESLAAPMIAILGIQTVFMALYAYYAVFKVTGGDYEGAAMTTASCGFGLGATPTAMANMTALFERYGVAPKAYFAVPLVGSVFIDLFNVAVITLFLNVV